jgi:hypothetical protein
MSKRLLTLLAVGVVFASLRAADPAPPTETENDTLQLPDMKSVGGFALKDFIFPAKGDIRPPDFSASDPFIKVQFPGRAVYDGLATGRATVGVMLDQAGKPVDFLLISYTKDYFGQALLEETRRREFTAKTVNHAAMPAAFIFTYLFEPPEGLTSISNFEAGSRRSETVQGGPKLSYEAHREGDLDAGQLEQKQLAVPVLPSRYGTQPVRALMSFYVDEHGKVRLPNVESALVPELAVAAVSALQQWAFKPPLIKGQPVLVHAMRVLTFRSESAAAPAK